MFKKKKGWRLLLLLPRETVIGDDSLTRQGQRERKEKVKERGKRKRENDSKKHHLTLY